MEVSEGVVTADPCPRAQRYLEQHAGTGAIAFRHLVTRRRPNIPLAALAERYLPGTGSTLRDGFGALDPRRCRQSLELPEGCFWPVELPWKVSPAPSFVGNPPCSSQNRTMVWVRRDLEDHPV